MARLQLFYPLKPITHGQRFGENKACCNPTRPITGVVSALSNGTCPAGKVKLYPWIGDKGHKGKDFPARRGQRISSSIRGKVIGRLTKEIEGLGVDVVTDVPVDLDPDPLPSFPGGKYYVKVRNYHMLGLKVDDDENVGVGEDLGGADNTGDSSGNHDHFELTPMLKRNAGGKTVWEVAFPNNGFRGGINPDPYWNGKYAEDHYQFRHTFYKNLEYGTHDPEIVFLQKALQIEGLLPKDFEPTDYYHNLTKAGVLAFWKRYKLTTLWENWILQGKNFGPKSRAKMNQLYG